MLSGSIDAFTTCVGGVEDLLLQPAAEGLVVAELFEQLGVVGEEGGHGAFEGAVVLDAGVLLVGVGDRVPVGLVRGHFAGQLLGNDLLNLVLVCPRDVAETVVEVANDGGQQLKLGFRLVAAVLNGDRPDFGVLVGQLDLADLLLFDPVAVHVDGLKDAAREVLFFRRRQLEDEEVEEDGEFLPLGVGVGQDGGQEFVGTQEGFGLALEVDLAVFIELDEDGQVDFKGKAKSFLRTYEFLAAILPYTNAEWEKLSIFLHFLVLKLPAPKEEDLSRGILEAIDMDSYRIEKQQVRKIQLADEDAEIGPVPVEDGGHKPEPELELLSAIIRDFNDRFGNIAWTDEDKIQQVITEELPRKVAADQAYRNAIANSDKQNARVEHDRALERAMTALLADHTELFKQFSDNETFRRWLQEQIFHATYTSGERVDRAA